MTVFATATRLVGSATAGNFLTMPEGTVTADGSLFYGAVSTPGGPNAARQCLRQAGVVTCSGATQNDFAGGTGPIARSRPGQASDR